MIAELAESTLVPTLENNPFVLVDFYADWCAPCKKLAPMLEQLNNAKLHIVKINVEEHPNLMTQMGVQSIPTLFLFRNGVETKKRVGSFNSLASLSEWITGA